MSSMQDRLRRVLDKRYDGKQKRLAEALGLSEASVSRWFSGSIPRDLALQRIADVAHVSYTWLTTGEGDMDELPVSDLSDAIASLSSWALDDPDTIGQLIRVLARLGPEYLREAHRLACQFYDAYHADQTDQQKKD